MSQPYAHLHCHSHYSLLDGASRVPELIAQTKAAGMTAVALTDHGNLYGAVELYREAKAAGVNPIIGYEAYVAPTHRTNREAKKRGDAGYHLTMLAQNLTGYKNLIKLASKAFLEGYHYVPRIDKELLEAHSEGIIVLSGCASSEFSELILTDKMDEAKGVAEWFARTFPGRFFVEIQNNGLEIQEICLDGAVRIADQLGLPLVATCDAHYLCRGDSHAHDVLLCINTGRLRSDTNRMKYGSDQFYVRSPDEMYKLFSKHPDAVKRSQEIADSCHVEIDFKARHFPVFAPPDQKTPEAYLRELCEAGMIDRYGPNPPEAAKKRLDHEFGVITRMGFASYFLITWDFVRFAREQGIPATARGSGCGAIVSYILKFSHVCPLEYDLLFERFLDPNRSEAPDIDIDFCQDRRELVIQYVKQRYGEASVAQIATFGTMAAKAALKDVGRVLDVPLERVNQLTKMVPERLGVTIDDALKESPDFKAAYNSDAITREWIDIALKLEGTNRNAGTHAAGVVIANGPITDYVPVHRVIRKGDDAGSKQGEAIITTQWVMGDLEKVGMLKMDFLGLRNLTVLDNAVKLIQKTRGETLDPQKFPLDDPGTYKLLQKGDAKGVFQLESDGIRELLKRMRPDNIRDIIAIMALYRPGPLGGGMVDSYVNRKHGREKWEYPHPVLKEILDETYGVMVYQEQIMRILNKLGGIELSSAYACIKAISKKKQDIIDARKADFIRGAGERGVDKKTADEIFSLIVFFGGYGFNKSHTAAYAQIGYQTAYLKKHYTPEFMAALLSSEIDDGNKRDVFVDHIADARKLGVDVRAPSVNEGEADFTVRGGQIVFGLSAIKGVGRGAVQALAACREADGPFRDLYDFCERVDSKAVPKAAVEKLIYAGAMDTFSQNRAALFAALPRALQSASDLQDDRRRGQMSFFDVIEAAPETAADTNLPDIPDWVPAERLKNEKAALDFYFSSHPLAEVEAELKRFATHTVEQMGKMEPGGEILIGGMLSQVRFFNTKKARNGNSRYVRCKIEDFTGIAECMMWPDEFTRFKDDFTDDRILFAKGTVERNRAEPSLVLTRVFDIETARREMTRGLVLVMALGEHQPTMIDTVARLLKRSPGVCPVYLKLRDPVGRTATLRASEEYRVNPAKVATEELEMLLGRGRVIFTGK